MFGQVTIGPEQIANVLSDQALIFTAENSSELQIHVDKSMVIGSRYSYSVAGVFEQRAVALLAGSKLALLIFHETEQKSYDDHVDRRRDPEMLDALFNAVLKALIVREASFHPGVKGLAKKLLVCEDHGPGEDHGEEGEKD